MVVIDCLLCSTKTNDKYDMCTSFNCSSSHKFRVSIVYTIRIFRFFPYWFLNDAYFFINLLTYILPTQLYYLCYIFLHKLLFNHQILIANIKL